MSKILIKMLSIEEKVGLNCRHCKHINEEFDKDWWYSCRAMKSGNNAEGMMATAYDYYAGGAGLEILEPNGFFCAMWDEAI